MQESLHRIVDLILGGGRLKWLSFCMTIYPDSIISVRDFQQGTMKNEKWHH